MIHGRIMPLMTNTPTIAVIVAMDAATIKTVRLRSNRSDITPKNGPAIRNAHEADPVSWTNRGECVASFM